MAVAAVDLLAPTGDLLPEFFPGEESGTVATRLDSYLAEGQEAAAAVTDTAARDAAAVQWAYHRAYNAIYVRLSHTPATVQVDHEAQVGRLSIQIQNFAALRDAALARFGELLAAATRPAATSPRVPVSDTTTLGVSW